LGLRRPTSKGRGSEGYGRGGRARVGRRGEEGGGDGRKRGRGLEGLALSIPTFYFMAPPM